MLLTYILLFIISCVLFYFAGKLVIDGFVKIAKFLGWKEFVVAFFIMAFACSLPNLFVGLSAAFRHIPELSFGDVAGNNLAVLTLAVGIAVLFSKKEVSAKSRIVRASSFFTMAAVLLPLLLILDGTLSRIDAFILLALFFVYVIWLFSKKERFEKTYKEESKKSPTKKFKNFLGDLIKIFFGLLIFIAASQGMVVSASAFAVNFNLSLVLVGILITGLGSTLPELYFDVVSAKKGNGWLVLGDLMGAIIIPSTLVLGIVALISPIHITNFSSLAIARIFIVIAAIIFPFFVRSGRAISKQEGLFLLSLYIIFLIIEIFFKDVVANSMLNFLLK